MVWQEDCSQHDSALDEVAQRSADLDDLEDLEIDLEDLAESITPAPHQMSRSLSRTSRTDPFRVRDGFLLIFLLS